MTESAFLRGTLGRTGIGVHRLGLAASYRPGKKTVYKAIDEGLDYFFYFGIDKQMTGVLREAMKGRREQFVVATGAYNYIWWRQDMRRTLEKRLRQLRTDYIDVFHFLGVMKPEQFDERAMEELRSLREDGRVRAISMSCHDRKFAGRLAAEGALDAVMIRYNAAHRGAEQDIFPHVAAHGTGVVSYTATRWTYLLRRPKSWPKEARVPPAGDCYRFVLSNPHVDVCLTAPRSLKEFEENLAAVRQGPLDEEEMRFMREFGDAVYRRYKWFM